MTRLRCVKDKVAYYDQSGAKHNIELCSYRAYNRCDGAGAIGKRLGKTNAKSRKPVITARDYAEVVLVRRF